MNQQTQLPKDTMIVFRSTKRGKNKKGGDHLALYMTTEQAQLLVQEITTNLQNPQGVKIDFHTSVKTAQDGSNRTFDSTIAFVKAVQERPQFGAQRTFSQRPNATVNSAGVTPDTIAKFKQSL